MPAHLVFEVLLIVTLVVAWGEDDVRIALMMALVSHAVMRVWSLVDFVPKALAFEKADPATVDEASAVRWTRRSLLRLPLDVIYVCGDARGAGGASLSPSVTLVTLVTAGCWDITSEVVIACDINFSDIHTCRTQAAVD